MSDEQVKGISDYEIRLAQELCVKMGECSASYHIITQLQEIERLRQALAALEAQKVKLERLLTVSEDFRRAYQDGKYKLYAMGGAICDAAADNLPMSEGPLDRACQKEVGRPQIRAEVSAVAALEARNRDLEEQIHASDLKLELSVPHTVGIRCTEFESRCEDLEARNKELTKPISIGEWGDAARNAPPRDNGWDRANRILAARAALKGA